MDFKKIYKIFQKKVGKHMETRYSYLTVKVTVQYLHSYESKCI